MDPSRPETLDAFAYGFDNPVVFLDPSVQWGWSNITKFVSDHKAEIVGAVAGFAVGAACLAITAGAGSIGCAALAGAVGGAITSGMQYAASTPASQRTAWGWVKHVGGGALVGGAIGALTGGLGSKSLAPLGRGLAKALPEALVSRGSALGGAVNSAIKGAVTRFTSPVTSSLSRASTAIRSVFSAEEKGLVPGVNGALRDAATGRFAPNPDTVPRVPSNGTHGNSLNSPREATLYARYSSDGTFQSGASRRTISLATLRVSWLVAGWIRSRRGRGG